MKIIFVGLHHKPGKEALCSSTKTGKLIDRIIEEGGFKSWQKTNLYPTEYLPKNEEADWHAWQWWVRLKPNEADVIVMLGAEVQKGFKNSVHPLVWPKILKVAHPASKRSHEAMNAYVSEVVEKIREVVSKKCVEI
jgi:hypothetical protein